MYERILFQWECAECGALDGHRVGCPIATPAPEEDWPTDDEEWEDRHTPGVIPYCGL